MNVNKKYFISIISIFIIICVCNLSYGASLDYVWSSMLQAEMVEVSSYIDTKEYTNDNSNPLNLDCGSCLLMEQSTRKNIIFL